MRNPRSTHIVAAALLGCIALLFAGAAFGTPVLPDFESATFVPGQPVDSTYFPMSATGTLVFTASEGGEPVDARFEHTNEGSGPVIAGVQTYVQRDQDFEDGLLIEDTHDYFAQDADGNVWYFGEDSTVYTYDDEGNLTDTETTGWRAGVNDAQPGFIMPADLTTGFNYYQEFAEEDDALDQATTYALLDSLTVDGVTYEDVLQVLETSELEPDDLEFKYYAPGVGLILVEEGLDEDFSSPERVYALQSSASVPEPTTLGMLMLGVAVIGALRRRR